MANKFDRDSFIEKEIIYRSDFMHTLLFILEEIFSADANITCQQIENYQDILTLYCLILNHRVFIIDDKEFKGGKQTLLSKFLSLD